MIKLLSSLLHLQKSLIYNSFAPFTLYLVERKRKRKERVRRKRERKVETMLFGRKENRVEGSGKK